MNTRANYIKEILKSAISQNIIDTLYASTTLTENYLDFGDFIIKEEKMIDNVKVSFLSRLFYFIRSELLDINSDIYLKSFKSNIEILFKQVDNGSFFFRTNDKKYIIISVNNDEKLIFENILYSYFIHLNSIKKNTLLPKFLGFYEIQDYTSKQNQYFVVMNNIFPSKLIIHKKYMFKLNRLKNILVKETNNYSYNNPNAEFKQMKKNKVQKIYLFKKTYDNLKKTIRRDSKLLRDCNIIGYSFLLGIHYVDNNHDYSDEQVSEISSGIMAKTSDGKTLVLFIGIVNILKRQNAVLTTEYDQNRLIHFFFKYVKL